MTVPSGLAPHSGTPEYAVIGVGVQNYTCQAGVWTSVGAVASLYDASCFADNTSLFNNLPQLVYNFVFAGGEGSKGGKSCSFKANDQDVSMEPTLQHFFVPAPSGTGLAPRFNLDDSSKYGIMSKTASITSPDNAGDVAWLQLSPSQGNLASAIYRIHTYKGQPPTTPCTTPSSKVLSVNYAAQYIFFA
ncbi:hypothetical protein DL93DRAFT_2078520 [Clavulina sp. PMI_390]|nr:hypothetical protein DL93DRAFT_2078520 [Clavulina sp. PMI_390]